MKNFHRSHEFDVSWQLWWIRCYYINLKLTFTKKDLFHLLPQGEAGPASVLGLVRKRRAGGPPALLPWQPHGAALREGTGSDPHSERSVTDSASTEGGIWKSKGYASEFSVSMCV